MRHVHITKQYRLTQKETDKYGERQTDRQIDKQTDKHGERQTDRQRNRQIKV